MPSFIDRLLRLTSSCLGALCQFGSDRIQRLAVAFNLLFGLATRHIERWGKRVDLDEGQRPRQQAELERLGGDQAVRGSLGMEEAPRRLVGHELDGQHLALAPDLTNEGMAADP